MTSIYTDDYQRVVELLVGARKAAGLSQDELAEGLSRPQSFVSKYERCERRLDIVEFVHICRLVKADATLLLAKAGLIATAKFRTNRRPGRAVSGSK